MNPISENKHVFHKKDQKNVILKNNCSSDLSKKIHKVKMERQATHPEKHHHKKHLEKPTPLNKEILQQPPVIYFFEINTMQDFDKFKIDLIKTPPAADSSGPVSYSLSSFGIDKEVPVIGNRFIPLRRSEHQEIHRAILEHGHKIGIQSPHELTFVIVEDNLWDLVLQELSQYVEIRAQSMPAFSTKSIKEPEEKARKSEVRYKTTEDSSPIRKAAVSQPASKATILKALEKLYTEESRQKEWKRQKEEQEFLSKEAFLKMGIAEYERLLQMIQKEAQKGSISQTLLKKRIDQWARSLPPFPIRGTELKSKMIEELSNQVKR